MQMALFLKNKIKRQIALNGNTFQFVKYGIDEFNQVSEDKKEEVQIKGIFHTTNSYIKNTDADSARLISKPQSMILCLYEDGVKINKDDKVEMQNNTYKVTGINDVNNFGVAFEISLELLDV